MSSTVSVAHELKLRHSRTRDSVRHWCARAATGASVVRVFAAGTKEDIRYALLKIPIETIPSLGGQEQFNKWFEAEVEKLARAIARKNKTNPRVNPGLKWGHAAKVLSLYLRDVVLRSRYFTDTEVERLAPWLFVPVDSKIINRLSDLGVRLPFKRIREISSRRDFYFVQTLFADNCGPGIARVVFDDVWADRER